MKKHILSNFKLTKMKEKKETTTATFTVENSDNDDFKSKKESTILTESVETSDRDI